MKTHVLFCACLMALVAVVTARNIEVPSYEELLAKCDFVVVARPAGKTRDTRETTYLHQNISPSVAVLGVVTEFECLAVLKGRKQRRFTLHHYRLRPDPKEPKIKIILNGPSLTSFSPDNMRHPFLMFLVRERDGRFSPAAGQNDPILSVQELSSTM